MWRRAAWSNGEMRTRRCTPASAEQQAVGVVARHRDRRALDPRLVAGLVVDDVALEAAALGPLEVHAQQHLGPVLRLGAARARVDGDDRVRAVVLAAEHASWSRPPRPRSSSASRPRAQVGARRPRPAPAHSTSTARSSSRFVQRVDQLDFLLEPAAALQRLLRFGLVVPEIGLGDQPFEAVQLVARARGLKDSSAARRTAWRDPGSVGRVRRARVPLLSPCARRTMQVRPLRRVYATAPYVVPCVSRPAASVTAHAYANASPMRL